MSMAAYTRLEVLRIFRNVRFMVFSLVFPLTMYPPTCAPRSPATAR